MGARLMRQETLVTLTGDGQYIKEVSAIKMASFTFKGEAVKSDYLGQPGPVFDEVNDGVDGKIDFEIDDPAFFDFLTRLIQRKQGLPGFQFKVNINTRFNFRTGVRRFCVVPDVSFGDLPLEIPERKQKVKSSLSFMAEGARFPRGV